MRTTTLLLAALAMVLLGIAPAVATPPGYVVEDEFTDGAVCDFGFGEASYGTPGYPNNPNQEPSESVLLKLREFEDGQGLFHQSVTILMEDVRYDLLDDVDGPLSFLASGTMSAHAWGELDENDELVRAFVSFQWRWTLTDLDGNSLGTSRGTIVDFGIAEGEARLVHSWQGVCIEP